MRPDLVVSALTDTVTTTLNRWPSEGKTETQSINEQLGYTGTNKAFVADVPPKFLTGNPAEVGASPRGYLLIVSLNHRYVPDASGAVAADYSALRRNVTDHVASCLYYFHQPSNQIYSFFTKFEHVLAGFNAGIEQDFNIYTALRKQTLFIDHLPYFSVKSGDFPGALQQRAAVDNRRFIENLIRAMPPKAILLNGKAASRALDRNSGVPFGGVHRYSIEQSKAQSQVGSFRYRLGVLEVPGGLSIRVVGCNFVASIYGPNTSEQKRELGTILAN